MRIRHNFWLVLAAVNASLAVFASAYRVYFLEEKLTDNALELFEWAGIFHIAHAIALLAVGLLLSLTPDTQKRLVRFCGSAFQLGILLFSGVLYWLAHLEPGQYPLFLFLIAVGGGCLIIGWSSLSYASWTIIVR